MKKILIALCFVAAAAFGASAQKFALVNMDYVLRNLPDYEMANEQLNQVSQRWEKEIVALQKEAETMYKNYQADMVFLTQEQQNKRAEEVAAKEKEVAELRSKYFGPEGELYKKPIQENIYNAVKAVSEERKYQVIFDRASSQSIIFASPTIDVSNEVLAKLGFSK